MKAWKALLCTMVVCGSNLFLSACGATRAPVPSASPIKDAVLLRRLEIGGNFYARDEFEQARIAFQRALERAEVMDDGNGIAFATFNLAVLSGNRHQWKDASVWLAESIAESQRVQSRMQYC